MLLPLYILIIIIGFLFLTLGLAMGQNMNNPELKHTTKKGIIFLFLFISLAMFCMGAIASFNIQSDHCENRVTSQEVIGGNTTFTNSISCSTISNVDEGMGGILMSLALINIVLLLYYSVIN